jgi:hypothetical protein
MFVGSFRSRGHVVTYAKRYSCKPKRPTTAQSICHCANSKRVADCITVRVTLRYLCVTADWGVRGVCVLYVRRNGDRRRDGGRSAQAQQNHHHGNECDMAGAHRDRGRGRARSPGEVESRPLPIKMRVLECLASGGGRGKVSDSDMDLRNQKFSKFQDEKNEVAPNPRSFPKYIHSIYQKLSFLLLFPWPRSGQIR